jgi:beta-lactamase class A
MRSRTAPTRSYRGWLTLLIILGVAAILGVGPRQLGEFASGLFFRRPPAAAITPALPHADSALQARLDAAGKTLSRGRMAAVAIDLQTGAMATVDATRAYPSASLFKLPVLLEVLAAEDAGQLDVDRQLEIRPEDWTDGSGVLQARVGESLSVRELTRLMIQNSDNIAALVLLDTVGARNTNALSEQLGLSTTRVVDRRAGEAGDHVTSADDMARLLRLLATGQALNQRVSEQALSLLELQQSVTWLGDDLPFWVKVAHKWGDLPDARHDAGIVFTPRGSYVIAVLTQDALADESASAIAQASRATYDYLGNR